jgi:nitronate monooxygenase
MHLEGISMKWRNKATQLLGSKYPIIQGAFGGFGRSELAAPVSAAGGFGIITASALRTPERLREDILKARSITDRPFGINLSIGIGNLDEMREVAIEQRVPVIFTAAYRAEDHGKRIKDAGLKWVHKVATVKHALSAERQGADAVVIVGLEGAGFKSRDQLPTLVSITSAIKQMKVPVIAAGGIGDARGFVAALGMGAEGIYMGTRFMATKECPISERFKQKLVEAQPWDQEYRERALAPPKDEDFEKVMKDKDKLSQAEWLQRLELLFLKRSPDTEVDWEDDDATLKITGASLAVGVIDSVVSVKELIDTIIRDAEQMLSEQGRIGELLT